MSVTNKTISCIGCNQAYDDAKHQPQVLDCGHGTCKTCVEQMVAQAKACPQCHVQVMAPIPNYDLIDKMNEFSCAVADLTKQYQTDQKAKDEKLAKAGSKLTTLKQRMATNKDLIEAGTASELVARIQELVDLGLYDDLEQAKSAFIAKMNIPAQTQPGEKKEKLTKTDDQKLKNIGEKISCVICTESYTHVGRNQPYTLDCGHGACGSCVQKMQNDSGICHMCRHEIKVPRPNYDFIAEIHQTANDMSVLAIKHRLEMKSKEEALSKVKTQASAIKEKLQKYAPSSTSSSTSTTTATTTTSINTFNDDSSEDDTVVKTKKEKVELSADKTRELEMFSAFAAHRGLRLLPGSSAHSVGNDSDEEEIDVSALPPVPTLPNSSSSTSTSTTTSTSNEREGLSRRRAALEEWKQKLRRDANDE